MKNFIFPAWGSGFASYGLIVGVLCLLTAVALLLFLFKIRGWLLQKHFRLWMLLLGSVGLLAYLLRYEQVPYSDSVLWLGIYWIVFIIWFLWLIYLRLTRVPKIVAVKQANDLKSRYLPKTKKHKKSH